MLRFSILLLVAFGLVLPAQGQDLDALVERVSAYEFGESRADLRTLEARIREATGDAEARAKIAEVLVDALSGEATIDAKRYFCRQLGIVGGASSVPALAGTLANSELAEMGLFALAQIDGPEATDALRSALRTLEGATQIAAVMALGDRRDAASFIDIGRLGARAEPDLRAAIFESLGRIADPNVATILGSLLNTGVELEDEAMASAAINAALVCAERREADGDTESAARLYALLATPAAQEHVRMAGLRGLAIVGGPQAGSQIVSLLMDDDELISDFGERLIVEVPGAELTLALADELAARPDERLPRLLDALARRGDRVAAPAIVALLGSDSTDVRTAAIRAMGVLGDGESAGSLIDLLAKGTSNGAIINSLAQMRDPLVSQRIAETLPDVTDRIRGPMIRVLALRRAFDQAGSLLEWASSDSQSVRAAAFDALGQLADESHIDALSGLVIDGRDRALAEHTLAAVMIRGEQRDAMSERVIDLFAGEDTEAQRSLLRVLAMVAGDSSLLHLRRALENPDLRETAIQSLARLWPDDDALDTLLEIASEPSSPTERGEALAGTLRLVSRVDLRAPSQSAAYYMKIAPMVGNERERRELLRGIAHVADPRTLQIAMEMFGDKALGADARVAALTIASRLGREHRLAALAAVDRAREGASNSLAIACDRAQNLIESDLDFITSWMVSGPYRREGVSAGQLIPTEFAPETGDRAVNWRPLRTTDAEFPGTFDLTKDIGGNDQCVYVHTQLWIPRNQTVRFEIGSDDGVKAWIDDDIVLDRNVMRGITLGEDTFEADLKRGWHTLMLKISQAGGGWAFACRVRSADGLHIPDLRAQANPELGNPPIGAIQLFDGTDLSKWMHPNGEDASWIVDRGRMTVRPGSGSILTREPLGDGLFYIEFMASKHPPDVRGQARGNSGVYLQGRYEVQVLDSWGDAPAINRCAAIYGKKAPDAAVASRPGEWQTYLIDFTQPRWNEGGEKTADARLTVWHNGVLVHDDVEVDSGTGAGDREGVGHAPLMLQDHANPVSYGRIWFLPRQTTWEGPDAPGFIDLIRGDTLDGWKQLGGQAQYEVSDAQIIGHTRPDQPNSFLCTERTYKDFVLEMEFKVDPQLNSGVQIRSNADAKDGRVRGYQIEIDPSERSWSAGIYDEARRGWLADLSKNQPAREAFLAGQWNRLRVVARGAQMQTFLNGVPCAELRDDMTPTGFISLQVHSVGDRSDPLEVRWRDIRIRELD